PNAAQPATRAKAVDRPPFVRASVIVEPDQMLSLVPADTTYAWTSIGAQDGVSAVPLDEWSGFFDTIGSYLQSKLAGDDRMFQQLHVAGLERLRDRYSAEGLDSTGLHPTPRFVVYGIGAFPAARIEISDAAKLLDFIERSERWARVQPEFRQFKSQQI